MIAIPLVAGVVGGLLAFWIWKFGLTSLGFLGGSCVGMLILSLKSGGFSSVCLWNWCYWLYSYSFL